MDNPIKEAIVLAGGFGSRLKAVVSDVPKPMADVNGKPFLYYLLDYLKQQGIEKVILSVGYKHESIIDFFGDHFLQMDIEYAIEKEPLGTGGAIKLAMQKIEAEYCYVLNGDTYFNIDLKLLNSSSKECVLAAKEMVDFDRYGSLQINENGIVEGFNEKKQCKSGWINGGIYRIHKNLLSAIRQDSFSFETEVLEPLSKAAKLEAINYTNYFMDIGIPEDYAQFKKDIYTPFSELKLNKDWTLFLDRDGVINTRLIDDYVKLLNELKIIKGVPEAIAKFNTVFNRIVVVTNQQGIGRGMMTAEDLDDIHGFMSNVFENRGGEISKYYFAPQLKSDNSNYRKPGTGMGLHAQQDYPEIDFSKSLLIGDSESDIEFGMKLGMKTILLTNSSNVSTKADYIFGDLHSVAKAIKTELK